MKRGTARSQFVFLLSILLTGCASSGPPLPPSLEVASPVTDLRALCKGNKVYLAWTEPAKTTDHQAIRHPGPTLICRSRGSVLKTCGTPIGELPVSAASSKAASRKQPPAPRTTATFTDSLPATPGVGPNDKLTYAVEVLNDRSRSAGLSNQVHVPWLPAIPPPNSFRAELTPQGVSITWSCPGSIPEFPHVEYRLRVYRRMEGANDDENIGEPSLQDCHGSPLVDASLQWEKAYEYRAAVVTVISMPAEPTVEIEGDNTATVRVVAHDVFPPAVPAGLQAVFSGPGQEPFVDLIWSPDTDADLAGYNIYRREESGQWEKLNSGSVARPAFRDMRVQSGKKYFYSVSAVDLRGNESAKSEATSESVP